MRSWVAGLRADIGPVTLTALSNLLGLPVLTTGAAAESAYIPHNLKWAGLIQKIDLAL